jgi:hypothetical protein
MHPLFLAALIQDQGAVILYMECRSCLSFRSCRCFVYIYLYISSCSSWICQKLAAEQLLLSRYRRSWPAHHSQIILSPSPLHQLGRAGRRVRSILYGLSLCVEDHPTTLRHPNRQTRPPYIPGGKIER